MIAYARQYMHIPLHNREWLGWVPQLDAVANCACLWLRRPTVERGEMVCNGSEGHKLQSENVQPAFSLLYGLDPTALCMCVFATKKRELKLCVATE